MSRLTELALLLAIAVLIVGIIDCDQLIGILTEKELSQTVPAPPQLTGMSGELSIGLLYPMTGRLAVTGAQMKQGFDLAVEEINHAQLGDATINFISVDDRSTVAGAVEGFNQLIRQTEVPAIIGPTTSSQCEAAFSDCARKPDCGVQSDISRYRFERDWGFHLPRHAHLGCPYSE